LRRAAVAAILLLAVLAAALSFSCRRGPVPEPGAAGESRPFTFVVIADVQFGFAEENRGWTEEEANLRWALGEIERLRPEFVAVLGDHVQEPGSDREAAAFKKALGELDAAIPVRLVAGNHDVGDEPTPGSLRWYRETFGRDRYAFSAGGCRFIVLNSGLLCEPKRAPEEAAAQERWLQEELAAARERKYRRIVLFQHHPWFWERSDEPESIETVSLAAREKWLPRLAENGVAAVFAGHAHANWRGRYGEMEMITVGPVARPFYDGVSGLMIVEVGAGGLRCRYREIPERLRKPAIR